MVGVMRESERKTEWHSKQFSKVSAFCSPPSCRPGISSLYILKFAEREKAGYDQGVDYDDARVEGKFR